MPINYPEIARKTLVEHLGDTGEDIFSRVILKKPISEKSSIGEVSDFIKILENIITAVSDQDKANEISLTLRSMIQEPAKQTAQNEKVENQNTELEDFLKRNDLPSEKDIMDYVKYLTLKYGGSAEKIKKELIENVRAHVKNEIGRNNLNEEILKFLARFSDPAKNDVDEFIKYLRLLKLNFQDEVLIERIEKIRLFRKFSPVQEPSTTENIKIKEFIYLIRNSDKETINKTMHNQGLSYLIKDESGLPGKGLAEFIELVTPNDGDFKDKLEGPGHKIKKKV